MKVKLTNEGIRTDYGANLLRARGIQDIDKFLKPDESCLQSWEDISGIGLGVHEIDLLAPDARIGLVVDCDVDGFTSASIIYQYLMRHSTDYQITPYIHDGKAHGLEEHWQDIADKRYDLVIVPDAGTNDSWYADEIQTRILVIDHHPYEGDSAPSHWMTLINNQLSPHYHNKNLSGAGMAYQFCRALDTKFGHNWADDYIDLAALGVCADMMSGLEVENQYLWRRGFTEVRNGLIWALARKQAYSITGKTDASDDDIIGALNPMSVAFYIVPLINAMIRVGAQSEKDELFQAFTNPYLLVPSTKRGAKGETVYIASEVARKCTNARTHQNKALDDAVALAEQKIYKHDLLSNKVLFIRLDETDKFPSELNGLLAMKLSQRFRHPTMVGRLGPDGYIKGSIRGLSNCELTSFKDFLTHSNLFQYVQGR